MPEPLNCPFCQSPATLHRVPEDDTHVGGYRYSCQSCGANRDEDFHEEAEALQHWNERPEPEPVSLESAVAALGRAIEERIGALEGRIARLEKGRERERERAAGADW